jgi:arginase
VSIKAFLVPYHLDELRKAMGAGPEAIVAAGGLAGLSLSETRTIVGVEGSNEVQACLAIDAALALEAHECRAAGNVLVVLSGNCHACLGTLAAIGNDVTIVWFDAHGDLNTPETTETGFFDGMALASALGWTWTRLTQQIRGFQPVPEEHVLLVGGRDLDGGERERSSRSRVRHYKPPALKSDEHTTADFVEVLAASPRPRKTYVHIDLDILDPTVLVANGYAVSGGVSLAWLESALRTIRQQKDIVAVGVTSYDPSCHDAHHVGRIVRRLLDVTLTTNPSRQSARN